MFGKREEFEVKATKEEREYFDTVQDHYNAKSQRDMLARQLSEAEAAQTQFQQASDRHTELKVQLDTLYNSIFAGPTPDFPEEDVKEWPVNQAQASYSEVQRRLEVQSQATSLLQQARQSMDRILTDIKDALSYSTADMWGFGTWTDIAERNSLSRAEMGVSNVEMLIQQAQRIDPSIQSIGQMQVANGHIMSDVIFDNIFTDMAMHDRIKGSQLKVQDTARKLDEELKSASLRRSELEDQAKNVAQTLENARYELQRVRQEGFERVAAGQVQQQSPPPYDYGNWQQQQW